MTLSVKMSLRASKREQSRDAILNAAESIFYVEGFAQARTSAIAAAAELSEKTLFNYFASKVELLEALVTRWFESNWAFWYEPDTLTSASIDEVFPPALEARVALLHEHRWLLGMAARYTDFFSAHRPMSEYQQHNFSARVARIKQLQQSAVVRSDLPAEEISLLYQVIRNHVISQWYLEGNEDVTELQQRFRRRMAVFRDGLRL